MGDADADPLHELRAALDAIMSAGDPSSAAEAAFCPTDTGIQLTAETDGEPIASLEFDPDYQTLAAVCNMWLEGQRERAQLRADIADRDDALRATIDDAEAVRRRLDGLGDVIDTVRPGMQEEALLEATLGALTELEVVDSAWVGFPTVEADSLEYAAGRGPAVQRVTPPADSPVVQAAIDERTTTTAGIETVTAWDEELGRRGVVQVRADPIAVDGVSYGAVVMAMRTTTLDPRSCAWLDRLLGLAGTILVGIRLGGATIEEGRLLRLESASPDGVFEQLARRLETTVTVDAIIRGADEVVVATVSCPSGSDECAAVASELSPVLDVRPLHDSMAVEITLRDAVISTALTQFEGLIESIEVSPERSRLDVHIPPDRSQRMILRQLRSIFGDLDLRLSQPYDDEIEPPWGYLAGEVLTPEQRHVLEAAYHQGYFDREDRRPGAEIAETIGIAQSTFSTRLRDAEGRLLGAIFGSTSAEPEQSERQQ
jgi:hypothetical protein